MRDFIQTGPVLTNTFESDRLLRSVLRRKLPPDAWKAVEADLRRFGERAAGDLLELARAAEAQPPQHVPYDPWGRRIDRIETSAAWTALDRVSAEEGIVAIGYERKFGALSRLVQFAKLYLFHPSSAFYSCPLAMTDGAARAIEVHGDAELKANAFARLTTRDPSRFWTSGQWMTERTGGSDVSGTSTEARVENGEFRLYGDKWFTSATTSQMAMTLARVPGAPAGSKGLSLFFIELRDPEGRLRNIRVNRLKDKLGTRALPTAELSLDGTPAKLIGGEGGGVRKIATLFNVTRMYNACCAVAEMRRGLSLARDYAGRRVAFGKPLSEQPLHLATLAAMRVGLEAGFHLLMHGAELLGKEELGQATPRESACLRGLMPVVKLFTGKQSVAMASEALEAIGGAAYIEDTGIPRLLRDSQVFSIWEGTTNVLSLDLLRAIEKDGAFDGLTGETEARLAALSHPETLRLAPKVKEAVLALKGFLPRAIQAGDEATQSSARTLALGIARTFAAALLIEHAEWSLKHEQDRTCLEVARRWCLRDLVPGLDSEELLSPEKRGQSRDLAMEKA